MPHRDFRWSRRLAICFVALTPACTAVGDFSTIQDTAWVDARGTGSGASDENVFIGYAPRDDVAGEMPAQFLVFNETTDAQVRYSYDQTGALEKSNVETDFIDTITINDRIYARSRRAGTAMLVVPQNQSTNYFLFGDIGEHQTGDVQSGNAVLFSGMTVNDDSLDVTWRAFAYEAPPANSDAEAAAFALGRRGSQSGDPIAVEGGVLLSDTAKEQCVIDVAAEGGTAVTPLDSMTILLAPEIMRSGDTLVDVQETIRSALLIVATDAGPLVVAYNPAGDPDADLCNTSPLSTELFDGEIQVRDVTGGDAVDVAGVSLGVRFTLVTDVDTTVRPVMAGAEITIDAPGVATGEWGSSYAIGDFDGDGDSDVAIADPGQGVVEVFDLESQDQLTVLSSFDEVTGYGKAVASVPFFGAKDLLVVGTDDNVQTYFRILASGDNDPR